MKAQKVFETFLNEFERGLDSKDSLDTGRRQFKDPKRFEDHIKNVKDAREKGATGKEDWEEELDIKLYAFIYRPKFVPVEVDGETLHKKDIEIENLYQIDRYDKSDLMAFSMMKIRATSQGEGSRVALVQIPEFLHDKKTAYDHDIKGQLRQWIKDHMYNA